MKAKVIVLALLLVFLLPAGSVRSEAPANKDLSEALSESEHGEEVTHGATHEFPPSLASYDDADMESIPQILQN